MSMNNLAYFIGQRFSRAKKRNNMISFISFSSIVGIAVGVAVVIVGLSAMNGFERELQQRILSVIPHGDYQSVHQPMRNWKQVSEQAEHSKSVVATAPFVRFMALAENGTQLKALEVSAISPEREKHVSLIEQFITPSTAYQMQPNSQQMILGSAIAKQLGLNVGDWFTLLVPAGDVAQQRLASPKRVRLQLVGTLKIGGQLDGSVGYMRLDDAQTLLDLGDSVHGIAVKTTDALSAPEVLKEVGNTLSSYVYVNSWKRKFGFIHHDIQLVKTIMYFVMVLVIGVACFNIVSTLMMAVKDRAAEIAILRTMGATDSLIMKIFMWQGVFSGLLGAMLGAVLGSVLALSLTQIIQFVEALIGHSFLSGDIYFVDFLPSQLHLSDVVLVSFTAVVLSLFATWWPARKATRFDPAVVLSSK